MPVMLTNPRELLEPKPDETILDLYCVYGLFSHFLAPSYKHVLGLMEKVRPSGLRLLQ